MSSSIAKVCLVGRPNVGKSTLFNVLTKTRNAIVDDMPGVTRDFILKEINSTDARFSYQIIDTGGYEGQKSRYQPFEKNLVWEQAKTVMATSDLIVCVLDGKYGLHPEDKEFYKLIIKYSKPVLFVVNKAEKKVVEECAVDFYKLGIEKFQCISAAHNKGVRELKIKIENTLCFLGKNSPQEEISDTVKLAIVGRPNVGKSSLLNRLLGETRSIVSSVSGTTRDPVDGELIYDKSKYRILDTAGMRRRTKVHQKVEIISSIKSYQTIQDADIVVCMIDASRGLEDQDARIIRLADKEYKPIIVAVNKWDLVENKDNGTQTEWVKDIKEKLGGAPYLPVHFMSCLLNQRAHKLMALVNQVNDERLRRVPTAKINEILHDVTVAHSPALIKAYAKRPKFYYATQVRVSPPTIVVKCNVADKIQKSYKRYLCNQLRVRMGFKNIQPRIIFRDKNKEQKLQARQNDKPVVDPDPFGSDSVQEHS